MDELLRTSEELEARFRDLESQMELDEIEAEVAREKRRRGTTEASRTGDKDAPQSGESVNDPLADLKSAFETPEPPEAPSKARARFMVMICQECDAKNRVPLKKLRTQLPVCGACKRDLAFWR